MANWRKIQVESLGHNLELRASEFEASAERLEELATSHAMGAAWQAREAARVLRWIKNIGIDNY